MIKELTIKLQGLDDYVIVTYSESEEDYVVRFPEALTVPQMYIVVNEIERVIR